MELYWKAITQQRSDSDKVYSLHCEGISPNQRLFGCSRMEFEEMDEAVGQRWKKLLRFTWMHLTINTSVNPFLVLKERQIRNKYLYQEQVFCNSIDEDLFV